MKVTQEKLPDSQVGLEIEVPADMSKQTYEQTLRKFMKTANIPGFRKGKVPRQILVQQLGATRLKVAALEELLQTVIDKAIAQEKIEALGNYQLRSGFESLVEQFEPGKVLTISASVDVPPQSELKQYKGLSIQAEEVVFNAERIAETLASYQQNLASLVPIEDRAAQEGDVAVIDFVGKILKDGEEPEEFEGGSASEFQVEIKEGRFIPGFVEGMVGMELGQTKDVDITFPDEYPQADLAGKAAVFKITLNDLKERELPALDDDLAQEVSEFETLEELKQSLEARFKHEAEDATQANIEKALLDELVTHLQVEIPKTLLQREVDHIVTQTVMQLSNQGIDINKFLTKELVENMRENAKPEAIERLRRTLALGEVANQESISVEEEAVVVRIKEMMAEVDDPSKIDQDRLKQVVNEDLLKEKILTWLSANATVELVAEGTLNQAEDSDAVDVNAEEE